MFGWLMLQSPPMPDDPTQLPTGNNSSGTTPDTESAKLPRVRKRTNLDLTTGPILPLIIRLALPSALTNLLNFSYNFINMLWLGRIGPHAIAVTATYHYFFMVLVFFNQIVGLGSISLISRTFGAKQYHDCRRLIGQTFAFKLVIAFVVMGLGLSLQHWAWPAFGSKPEVVESGLKYSTIMFSVIPFYFSAFTLRTSLTAIGDMKTLLKISIISSITNVVLDPIMIFERIYFGPFPALGISEPVYLMPGLGLGVAGAAWASFVAILLLICPVLLCVWENIHPCSGALILLVELEYRTSHHQYWGSTGNRGESE